MKRSESDGLFPQQRFVREYLGADSPHRGLVLYHGLGSGKTCSAIAVAENLRAQGGRRRVLVVLPAALRRNYVREMRVCGADDLREAGLWVRDAATSAWRHSDRGKEARDLEPAQRAELEAQLEGAAQDAHALYSYNSTESMARLLSQAPFDDAVVIIDEVHNFVGRVVNARAQAVQLYGALMSARRCKLVLLSGTPLVNRPEELAVLVNLAAGPVRVHTWAAPPGAAAPDVPWMMESFSVMASPTDRRLAMRFAPDGYCGVDMRMCDGPATESERVKATPLRQYRGALEVALLPADADAFRAAFIRDSAVVNADVLVARMAGLVSFFPGHDASVYPRVTSIKIRRWHMSSRQYIEYAAQRSIEIRRERSRRRGSDAENDSGAAYRPLSRMACNFAFPAEIPRPLRSSDAYLSDLDAAVKLLEATPGRLRAGGEAADGLRDLSPKMDAIVADLMADARRAIVYSQFRRAEGVNLLAAALRANGFADVTAAPPGTATAAPGGAKAAPGASGPSFIVYESGDADALARFNAGGARALLISASGAEGISTRGVRKVHVMEPFWHANRIDQVIGRAVRAHSHDDLPPAERTVDVVVHIAALSAPQAKQYPATADDGLSSDEHVHQVAQRKRQVLLGLLAAMRSAAVDCKRWGLAGCAEKVDGGLATARAAFVDTADLPMRARRAAEDGLRSRLVRVAPGRFRDPVTGRTYTADLVEIMDQSDAAASRAMRSAISFHMAS